MFLYGFEVLAGNLMRETEKSLVLKTLKLVECSQGAEGLRTRSRWLSALSFVVVSSVMLSESKVVFTRYLREYRQAGIAFQRSVSRAGAHGGQLPGVTRI